MTAKKTNKRTTSTTKAKKYTKSTKKSVESIEPIKETTKIISIWELSRQSAGLIWKYRKIFFGLAAIYGLLIFFLARGFGSIQNISGLKSAISSSFNVTGLAASLGVFVTMLGSAGSVSSNDTSGPYQVIVTIIISLAIIWSLRQILASKLFKIRDAFYLGMYPLVPFILILALITIQILPLILGSILYQIIISYGIVTNILEFILCLALFLALASISFYLISSSIFAIYIVTLPGMTPKVALITAKELVQGRRWMVIRKIIALPIILILAAAVIMIPVILVATPLAQLAFYILTVLSLVAVHTYMYLLYRNLMNE